MSVDTVKLATNIVVGVAHTMLLLMTSAVPELYTAAANDSNTAPSYP